MYNTTTKYLLVTSTEEEKNSYLDEYTSPSRQRFPRLPCTGFRTTLYHTLLSSLYAFSTTPRIIVISSVIPSVGGTCVIGGGGGGGATADFSEAVAS